jgi:hypothetical protein
LSDEIKEDVITRIGGARDFATKEANRFFLAALLFTLLFGAKTAGYHIDEIVLQKDVGKLPNGAFVYLVIAQSSMAFSQIRYGDAHALESVLKTKLQTEMIQDHYPNQREWYSPMTHSVSELAKSGIAGLIFNITSLLSMTLALITFLLPSIAGFYFIGNPIDLEFSLSPNIELTVVVISTLTCTLWIINSFAIFVLLGQARKAGAGVGGSDIQGRGSGSTSA